MFAAQRLCSLGCFVLCRQIRRQFQPSNQPKADHLLADLSIGITNQSAPQLLGKTPRCLRPAVSLSHLHLQHQGAAMRTELDVPFSHKEEAKALGAKWDRTKKIWYVPSGVNPEPFAEWLPGVDRSDPSAPYIYLVLGKRECWKCHKETSVAAFGIPYRTDNDESVAIARAQRIRAHCHRHGQRQRTRHRARSWLRAGRDPRLPS